MADHGTEGKTAFVLAGGGAKGAFEAGAIGYLIEERGTTPEVVTAASAGAIVAVVLAQARSHAEFLARAAELQVDLLAMTDNDRVFGRPAWVRALAGTPFEALLQRAITDRTRPPVPGEEPLAGTGGDPAVTVGGIPGFALDALNQLQLVFSLVRAVPGLSRARRAMRTNASSMMTLEPLERALRQGDGGIGAVDPALIDRPGLELRLAVVPLAAGELRYVTGSGVIVGEDALTPVEGAGGGPVDVVEGALASSSVPMIFPPRPMADDVYVDGGVLDNVPVHAAVQLGATDIYAVLAVPLALPEDHRDFARLNMVGVFLRSMAEIDFADRQKRSLRVPLPEGARLTVIDPLVDVVGPFEVDRGLMAIDMDYGWLRAADVVGELDGVTKEVADATTNDIVVGRVRAWHREEELWRRGRATPDELAGLRAIKASVADAVARRKGLGLALPEGAVDWAAGFESHRAPAPAGLAEVSFSPG